MTLVLLVLRICKSVDVNTFRTIIGAVSQADIEIVKFRVSKRV
jgi:hypothetical protein